MPIVNVIVGSLLLEHDIGVALVKLSMELCVLLDWLELLDSVHFELFFTCLGKEGLSLFLQFTDVFLQIFAVQSSAFVVSFNHLRLLKIYKLCLLLVVFEYSFKRYFLN